MAFDPRSIDEMPLFKLMTDMVVNSPSMLGRGLARLGEGLGGLGGSLGGDHGDGVFSSIKESIFGERDKPVQQASVERVPSMEVQTPAPSLGKYEVAMSELGGFSAPTFGNGVTNQGVGVRMG